jgi:NAD(P)-dependent dehydrogenase (short-subunit alcohol dehydrogenase family)
MEKTEFSSRNYIVTGGTQGLGRGVAEHLASLGAGGIVICGRNEENGARVRELLESAGSAALYVRADLQYEEDCRNVVRQAEKKFGTIHGLVNAAGLTRRGTLESTSVELWDLVMKVNARAPFILIQETVRIMKKKGIRGSIVNMISDNCHGGQPFNMAYAASKGALATLTKNLAHALLRDRIRVNGICLGWMYTPHEQEIQVEMGQPENWLELVEKEKPFGRLLRPRDLAYLSEYLLSDRSEMRTGSLIDFDQKVIGGLD